MQCALNIYQHLISFVVLQMEYMLPFWHYDCINIDHTARGSIFHTVSFHHTSRLRGYGKCSPKGWLGGCQCCLGDIVLYCMLSLTPAEFVWTRIWSISGFYFFLFSSFFLFCSVISQRWRSDTFDNSGPCGVNTAVIAQSLCLRESTSISECLSPPCLFTDRQGKEIGTKRGKKEDEILSMQSQKVGRPVLLRAICVIFLKTKIKTCSFPGNTNGQFHKRYTSVTESW